MRDTVIIALIAAVTAGCAMKEPNTSSTRSVPAGPPPVVAKEIRWRGWSAIEQSNGLMTLRTVPSVGGRTLSLEIGGDDAILVFPEHLGRSYPADSRDNSVHYGGHYSCIGPERIWNVHDQPFNPHAGPYEAEMAGDGDNSVLKLTSLPDEWKNARISMARSITMRRGTTHVVIDEQVTNRGDEPLSFYLWDFTQIDGRNEMKPDRPIRNITTYLPVPTADGRKVYTSFFPPGEAMQAQFDESLDEPVLAIDYKAAIFKVASHADRWWVATVDHDSGWTYVKAFEPDPTARYVDNNGPIEVFGSGLDFEAGQFVEMELLTGIDSHAPGQGVSQREHWYACICKGPVRSLTPVGVVCEPPAIRRQGDEQKITGRFGVFYQGTVRVEVIDSDGRVVAAGDPISVDPREELLLDAPLPEQRNGRTIVLSLYDHADESRGELARVQQAR